ncbi:MAG: AAA family ATPase [Betaproteobacteria bacterium]|nr:AAA family ATPase [Betaproteobacteria bacterium]
MNKVRSIVPLVAVHAKTTMNGGEVQPDKEAPENMEIAAAAVEQSEPANLAAKQNMAFPPQPQPHSETSVYLEFFGLREAPFRLTPHTDFFFPGANRSSILDALVYAVTLDEGIVKVSGEVGSGKTMLCRMLLEKLPPEVISVYLPHPSLSRDEVFFSLVAELGLDGHDTRNPALMLRALQKYLLKCYSEGKRVVILIDEAHAMPGTTLEDIRLLSNLESDRHKLAHIVLFGQPELDTLLAQRHMRPLRERITHNFALGAVCGEEIGRYLEFRLRIAGYQGLPVFTPAALRLIHSASEGLLRRVNIIADKTLLAAFAQGVRSVDARLVRRAIRDAEFLPLRAQSFFRRHWTWLAGAGACAALAAGVGFLAAGGNPFMPHSVAPSVPPVVQTATENLPPAPASADSSMPAASLPENPATSLPAPAAPADEAQIDPELLQGLGPRTSELLRQSQAWLRDAPSSRYFLQIERKDINRGNDIERSLTEMANLSFDQTLLRVYRSHLSGRDRVGIIYGDYPSREAALAAIETLPPEIRAREPYPRTVEMLR